MSKLWLGPTILSCSFWSFCIERNVDVFDNESDSANITFGELCLYLYLTLINTIIYNLFVFK